MTRHPSVPRILQAPMAVASDGSIILNMAATYGPTDPRRLLERALAEGRPVFVGVALTAGEMASAMKSLEETAVEVSASLWQGRRGRR